MKKDTLKAKQILLQTDSTCVFLKGDVFCKSQKRGVEPLLEFLKSEKSFDGFCAADKVVGRGAAFLYVKLNVDEVYAEILSEGAKEVFEQNSISFFCDRLVPKIQNRTKTGFCPIETAVSEISLADEAIEVICKTLEKLK